ncbi:Disks large 1 tumor suppressor protein like [Argiope bruennichi]|uniref:Disks large 1 tumor suppressor protein like n=1 Tax=Argiope bruennichi TaxID=94029 RepID=A0A8T0FUC8_ARGBR|nr:Disks large 1 tumor suppressor protein like [Argiope bruennichi]
MTPCGAVFKLLVTFQPPYCLWYSSDPVCIGEVKCVMYCRSLIVALSPALWPNNYFDIGGLAMPVRKQEAHRALELLEEYHCKLNKPQDKQLRNAIERVIRIFKSRLFQALLDIQEFYEITLLDDTKSIQQKTAETLQIASKWENSPPLTQNNESKYRYKEEDEVEVSGYKDIPELDGFPRNIVERAVQERFISSSESPTPPRKSNDSWQAGENEQNIRFDLVFSWFLGFEALNSNDTKDPSCVLMWCRINFNDAETSFS